MKREAKNERGGRGRGRKPSFLSSPLPPRLLAPFFAWPLLRNSTETLASQATIHLTGRNLKVKMCRGRGRCFVITVVSGFDTPYGRYVMYGDLPSIAQPVGMLCMGTYIVPYVLYVPYLGSLGYLDALTP